MIETIIAIYLCGSLFFMGMEVRSIKDYDDHQKKNAVLFVYLMGLLWPGMLLSEIWNYINQFEIRRKGT